MTRDLHIGFLSTLYHTSHILREARWLEQELGVPARWSLFGTGPEMVKAFEQDDIQVGYLGLPPAMIGISRGAPLVCIGGGHVEGTLMIAGPSYKGLDELGSVESVLLQFSHARVGIPARGSIHDVIFRHLLARNPVAEVRTVNYDWADLIFHALLNGEIDAAVGTPPLAVLCERGCGTRIVIQPEKLWPFNPSYGIVVQRNLLLAETLLEGFLLLHERACNLILQDPKHAAHITVRALPWLDEGLILKVYGISPRYCASLPDSYVRSTLEFLPALQSMGYLKEPPRPASIFETRFIDKVHPASPHY